jgi:tRNA(fMet)-specific endonuclease VapC
MRNLLDSNICITIMNRVAPFKVESAMNLAIHSGDALLIPTIVVHEMWYGVARSRDSKANANKVVEFLTEPFQVLEFDLEDADKSGEIRPELARQGTPIGPYDVLIAGKALARGITLVTANTKGFSRVDGLTLADWTQ